MTGAISVYVAGEKLKAYQYVFVGADGRVYVMPDSVIDGGRVVVGVTLFEANENEPVPVEESALDK